MNIRSRDRRSSGIHSTASDSRGYDVHIPTLRLQPQTWSLRYALGIPVAPRRRAHMEHPHANQRCCCGEFTREERGLREGVAEGLWMLAANAVHPCVPANGITRTALARLVFFLFPCVPSCSAAFALHCPTAMYTVGNFYVIAAVAVIGGGLFGFDISSMSAILGM